MPSYQKIIFALSGIASFAFAPLALARVDYVKPATADVDNAYPGAERITLTTDGGMQILTPEGKPIDPKPGFLVGEVFVGGPLASDIYGSSMKDLVAISIDATKKYTLNLYDYDGGTNFSAPLTNRTVYYDPQELKVPGLAKRDILLTTGEGSVLSYRVVNNNLVETVLISKTEPVGATPNSTGDEMLVTYPNTAKISVYKRSGSWIFNKDIVLASPAIYPATYASSSVFVVVQKNNNLSAYDKNTGLILAGFPVALGSVALDSATVAEVNPANSGPEIVVPLANGKNFVYTFAGQKLSNAKEQRSFTDVSGLSANPAGTGLINTLRNFVNGIFDGGKLTLASALSKIKLAIGNVVTAPSIEVSVGANQVAGNSTYDFGTLAAGATARVDVTITNTGNSNLVLNGNPTLTGTNANEFSIITQPSAIIAPGATTTLTVQFAPTTGGAKVAALNISSNDTGNTPFVINFVGALVVQPTTKVIYEDAENGNTVGWSLTVAGTTSTIANVVDDANHGRAIEITLVKTSLTSVFNPKTEKVWDILSYPTLEWEEKSSADVTYTAYVETNTGWMNLIYTTNPSAVAGYKDATYMTVMGRKTMLKPPQITFKLDSTYKNGTWKKITRNLQQDISAYVANTTIKQLSTFAVFGTKSRVDNINLQ